VAAAAAAAATPIDQEAAAGWPTKDAWLCTIAMVAATTTVYRTSFCSPRGKARLHSYEALTMQARSLLQESRVGNSTCGCSDNGICLLLVDENAAMAHHDTVAQPSLPEEGFVQALGHLAEAMQQAPYWLHRKLLHRAVAQNLDRYCQGSCTHE
jgi:hypothetical protein